MLLSFSYSFYPHDPLRWIWRLNVFFQSTCCIAPELWLFKRNHRCLNFFFHVPSQFCVLFETGPCKFFYFFFYFFKKNGGFIEYSSFTRLWSFLLYHEVIQLHGYTHPFFFRFFSYINHHGILGRAACAIQQVPLGQSFHIPQCTYTNSKPPHPSLPTPAPQAHLALCPPLGGRQL